MGQANVDSPQPYFCDPWAEDYMPPWPPSTALSPCSSPDLTNNLALGVGEALAALRGWCPSSSPFSPLLRFMTVLSPRSAVCEEVPGGE